MFHYVRRAIAGSIRFALRQTGRDIVPLPPHWISDEYVYQQIADLRLDVVLDVGANDGYFARKLRSAGYSGRIISFEPQSVPFLALRDQAALDSNWESHRLAIGQEAGTLSMHVSAFSPSSSLLPIGNLHVDLMPETSEVGVEDVTVVRLDEWLSFADVVSTRVFLKLDVQGYELPALRGAGSLLHSFVGALVELNFAQLFDGQSNYYDVMTILEIAGLRFVRLTGVHSHPRTGDLLWADALFLR